MSKVTSEKFQDEIVISGMAGKFPNSRNVDEFRESLFAGIDLVDDLETRWKHLNEDIPKRFGKIGDIEKFDAHFFSVPMKQANRMDPQVRILLQLAHECLLDAGVCPKIFRGSQTGVYIGCSTADSDEHNFYGPAVDGLGLSGSARSLLANRISYVFDLKGPSVTVDSACSSGGYALDLAFKAIQSGGIESALVGSSNIILNPATTQHFARIGVLSKDGFCRSFDKNASGYCRSEAVNMILIQKFKDAKRVYATIMHTKVNVDGFKNEGLMHPSNTMQARLLEGFYQEIGVDSNAVNYVEAHGTATEVGDPEECATLDAIFCKNRKDSLLVGSVKSNMGHSEAASTICSVIKCLLAFENGKISPNLHYKEANPEIPALVSGRLKVVDELQEFKGHLIAINSFGFGGANFHALLRINTKEKNDSGIPPDDLPRLVIWSGRTEEAVNLILDSILEQPLDAEYIALLQSAQVKTQASNVFRGFGVFKQDQKSILELYLTSEKGIPGQNASCILRHVSNLSSSSRPIVFVYSGIGSQWNKMGTDLMRIPLFEAAIKKCQAVLANKIDLLKIITSDDPKTFDNILNSFVGITAIQIALTDILRELGIEPDFIVGHSVGELACAYADCCMTVEETILAAYFRGIVSIETKVVEGSMAALGIGYEELKEILPDGIEIACHNSSDNSTISGLADKVKIFVDEMSIKGIFAKEVSSSKIPLHSSYVADMGPKLFDLLKNVLLTPRKRSSKWISSSVSKNHWNRPENQFASPEYFVKNLLSPVLFKEACESLPRDAITIEIAPHGLLQAILKRSLSDGLHIPLTKRGHKENSIFFVEALGKLFESGIDMDISKLYPPVEFPVSRSTKMVSPQIRWDHSENFFVPYHDDKEVNDMQFKIDLKDPEFKFISGHCIDGRVLFPATGYLFLVWKLASKQHLKPLNDCDIEFEDVKFLRATYILDDKSVNFNVVINRGTGKFEVSLGKNAVVTGIVRGADSSTLTPIESNPTIDDDLTEEDFYKEMKLRGYHQTDLFRKIVSARMDGSSAKIKWESNWIAFLDCLVQMQVIGKDSRSLVLPTNIRKFVIKTKEHQNFLKIASNGILTAHYCKDLNMLRCGGIEIRGQIAQTVNRRPFSALPVLESYKFISNFPTTKLSRYEMARFCIQLMLENLQTSQFFSVEIDNDDGKCPLSEEFRKAVNKIPVVTANLTYLTSNDDVNLDGVNKSIESFSSFSNLTLIIRSNCLVDNKFLDEVTSKHDNFFILSREPKFCNIFEGSGFKDGFEVVAVVSIEDETIVLVHYRKIQEDLPLRVIKISNCNIKHWLPELQQSLKLYSTLVYAQREEISGILGLMNCIRKEPNGKNLRCFFIDDPIAPDFDIQNSFYKSQLKKNLFMNVFRNGRWGSYKYLSIMKEPEVKPQEICCFASCLQRGDLSSIKWIQNSFDSNQENLVKVKYASLNFKDVMLATGKFTVDKSRLSQNHSLGMEFSGITSSGRRIAGAITAGALASHVKPDEVFIWDCPQNWTLAQGATIPIVYGTVYLAFFIKTKIAKGNSILIHAGSGGVGLAAIQVALAYSLKVFTTVSTEEKKKFLLAQFPQLTYENIGNSRDTSFEDLIVGRTKGRGVDFVLNSLSEEKLQASLRCLAKGGKFIEIGKIDMASDNKLGMREFLKDLSFHAVVLDDMFDAPYEKKLHLKKLLETDLKNGIIKPLKYTSFEPNEIEKAFRFLASGKHIGKVLIQMRGKSHDTVTLPMEVLPRIYFKSSFSYIIVGGLGGVGLEIVDWMVLRGCRKLVLCSTRGITESYQRYRIRMWQSYGVEIKISTEDITTHEGCETIIKNALDLGPAGGIFNLAVRLRDALFENQTYESINTCMAPKATATEHLDRISRNLCPHLEHFVVFSSVACGRGNAGQSNYGMANSVSERIIEKRRKEGFPGKAVQFGAIDEVGLLSDMKEKEIAGTLKQRISSCLEALDVLLTEEEPIVSSLVVAEKASKSEKKKGILDTIMNIMSIKDTKNISMETKLSELGIDSLMTVEISQALESQFNIVLSSQEIQTTTLNQLRMFEAKKENHERSRIQNAELDLLFRNLGNEARVNETILKCEGLKNEGVKALIIPGVEGVAGEIYFKLAAKLEYSTYLLQYARFWDCRNLNELVDHVIKDVLDLYENDTKFLLIGYSYGSMIALKIGKVLEEHEKKGNICLIDGSPRLFKHFYDKLDKNDESLKQMIFDQGLKIVLLKDTSQKATQVLSEQGWEEKIQKFNELYGEIKIYSNEYIVKILTAVFNRIKLLSELNLEEFSALEETSLTLIKPLDALIRLAKSDHGLESYSKEVKVHVLNGNHKTILENSEMAEILNKSLM